jgi:hypothetical protein
MITNATIEEKLRQVREESRANDMPAPTHTMKCGRGWIGPYGGLLRGDPQWSKNTKWIFSIPKK